MATLTWASGINNLWSRASNWVGGTGTTVPDIFDTAVIGAGTIFDDVSVVIAGLTQDGSAAPSVLTGAPFVGVYGTTTLFGDVVHSSVGTTELHGPTLLGDVGVAGTLWLDAGRTVRNYGTMLLADGAIVLGAAPGGGTGGGNFIIQGGAALEIKTTGTVIAGGSGSIGVVNAGSLAFDGPGSATITAPLTNSGTLTVGEGELRVLGALHSSGAGLVIGAAATLAVGSAGLTITNGIFRSAGTLSATGGTIDFSAGWLNAPDSSVVLDDAVLRLAVHTGSAFLLDLHAGSSVITEHSIATFQLAVDGPAVLQGPAATTVWRSGVVGTGTPGDAAALYLDGGMKLVNRGTLTLAGGTIVVGGEPSGDVLGSGTLANATAGTLVMQDGAAIFGGAGTIALTNLGMIDKPTGSGTAVIGMPLTGGGRLHVGSGTIQLQQGGKLLASHITVDPTGALGIGGGTLSLVGAFSLSGGLALSGGVLDTQRATTVVNGAFTASGGTLVLGSHYFGAGALEQTGTSVVNGVGIYAISGAAHIRGVDIETGSGATVLGTATTLDAGAQIWLDGGRQVENAGTILDNGAIWHLGGLPSGTPVGDASMVNLGSYQILADGTLAVAAGGYAGITNYGAFVKSAGSGTSTVGVAIVNEGSVEVSSGTLALAAVAGTGSFVADDGCVLDFLGAVNSGTVSFVGNAGTVVIEAPSRFAGTISGFGGGSVIDLVGITTPSLSYTGDATGGTLSVGGTGGAAQLLFSGDLTSHGFGTSSDGHGGFYLT